MKIVSTLAALVCLLSSAPALAQTPAGAAQASPPPVGNKIQRSQALQSKIHEVDLLVSILPLVMTKDQIKVMLLTLEKVRAKQIAIFASEDDEILKLAPEVEDTLTAGITKGEYPHRELQSKVYNVTRALMLRRQVALNEYIDEVYVSVDRIFNAGQKKAMAGSLAPSYFAPGVKPETLKDEDKIKAFIRIKLLDDATYPLLIKLSK